MADLVDPLARQFELSDPELKVLLPSGRAPLFLNRLHWAKLYLKQAGLVEVPARGVFRITARGSSVLAEAPQRVDIRYLSRFPEFVDFRRRSSGPRDVSPPNGVAESETPEEVLETTWKSLRQQTADDLLERTKQCSPTFFERLVIDLLVAMGYGGSRPDAARSVGRSGDGGIDGTINEDKLGLDTVYVQAKRWDGAVGRPVVQGFAGSLEGVRARKGVLMTTSSFTADAHEYVRHIEKRIVLIDGKTLADLMMDYGIGVTATRSYTLHRIDQDYFEEE